MEADRSAGLLFANQAAYRTSGYTPEEIPEGLNVHALLVPEDRERTRQNIAELLQDGRHRSGEFTAQRKDGSVTYVIGTGIDRTGEQQPEKGLDGRW